MTIIMNIEVQKMVHHYFQEKNLMYTIDIGIYRIEFYNGGEELFRQGETSCCMMYCLYTEFRNCIILVKKTNTSINSQPR